MPEENTNQPIDLSELANLQFSTAWSPSTNYSGFEDRKPARGGFKKRGEFDAKNPPKKLHSCFRWKFFFIPKTLRLQSLRTL